MGRLPGWARGALAGLLLLVAGAPAAQAPVALPCGEKDVPCLRRAIRADPVRRLGFWQAGFARPVAERIGTAPPELVRYITMDNIVQGFPERPRVPRLDASFLADAKAALAEIPAPVLRLFERRLVGIYFVDDLGGTGYTDFLVDEAGKPVAGVVVLDSAVLGKHTANQWATWKENTPFKPDGRHRLDARIQDAGNDNRKNAIAYILLHELAHVLAINSNIHPLWDLDPKDVPVAASFPFFDLSWRNERFRNSYFSLFDLTLPQREQVAYYLGAKLGAADMLDVYARLEQTNFPTLYAVTRPGDDFAESFASYVHTVLQGRPWAITLTQDGKTVKTFKTCWEAARCAEKRRLLEGILTP
jgi:hypothetical protein